MTLAAAPCTTVHHDAPQCSTIPIAALGRLNAHARHRGAWTSNVPDAIYAYKLLAALTLFEAGAVAVRFVRSNWKCNRCTDGWYHGQYDGEKWRCRYCNGSMTVALRFTETTLPDGQVWMHPWEGRTNPGISFVRGREGVEDCDWTAPSEGWAPNMPAGVLAVDELVPLLNEAEDWVETAPDTERGLTHWYVTKGAKSYLHSTVFERCIGPPSHRYALDLGAWNKCMVCGSTEKLGYEHGGENFGMLTKFFHWSLRTCGNCGKMEHPQLGKTNDELHPPEEMMTPALRTWLARHSKVVRE